MSTPPGLSRLPARSIVTILPNRVYHYKGALTPEECRYYIDYIDVLAEEYADDSEVEKCGRFVHRVMDATVTEELWEKLHPLLRVNLPQLKGCSPRMPVIRYTEHGNATNRHRDPKWYDGELYGALVYLNDDFPDGRTVYYGECFRVALSYKPVAGDVIVFHMDTLHSSTRPGGVKYLLSPRFMV